MLSTPRATVLYEIRARIKGTMSPNVLRSYGAAWNIYMVLYIECYVKQSWTELNMAKVIILHTVI